MTDLIERPPSEVVPAEPGATPVGPYQRPEPSTPGIQGHRNVPHRLDSRPESRPDEPIKRGTTEPMEDSHAERLLTTQAPQRPQATPRIRIEVDGRTVEGLEGQTILEVCRDNGIEIPTLCYEPKLPGFGS